MCDIYRQSFASQQLWRRHNSPAAQIYLRTRVDQRIIYTHAVLRRLANCTDSAPKINQSKSKSKQILWQTNAEERMAYNYTTGKTALPGVGV